MTRHDKKKLSAIEAIQAVHGDDGVNLETTRDSLNELRSEVETLLEAIESDIENARVRRPR